MERKPLVSDIPEDGAGSSEKVHSFSMENSWNNGDTLKNPHRWASFLQSREVAQGAPIIGALVILALIIFASSRKFELDGSPSTMRCSHVLEEDLRRAEEQYQENVRQREWALTASLNEWRQQHPAGVVKEVWFCPPYPCPNLARFGMWGEGGKWVCLSQHEANPTPIVVSIGSAGDTSFEQEIARRLHAFSHTFDFTLDQELQQALHRLSFLKFHDAGLSGKANMEEARQASGGKYSNATILTIDQVLPTINLKRADILKLDCEGCEFAVVKDMVNVYTSATAPFGQILLEVHELKDEWASSHIELVKSLESLGYRMFFSEINPYYPASFELAFIHESLVKPL